ncbi:hypothetical protein NL676_004148 [Syzygium grande]|nr:hypothetical protein NL676_004148 [Syzygium grande]
MKGERERLDRVNERTHLLVHFRGLTLHFWQAKGKADLAARDDEEVAWRDLWMNCGRRIHCSRSWRSNDRGTTQDAYLDLESCSSRSVSGQPQVMLKRMAQLGHEGCSAGNSTVGDGEGQLRWNFHR